MYVYINIYMCICLYRYMFVYICRYMCVYIASLLGENVARIPKHMVVHGAKVYTCIYVCMYVYLYVAKVCHLETSTWRNHRPPITRKSDCVFYFPIDLGSHRFKSGVPSQVIRENGKYNPILVWLNKVQNWFCIFFLKSIFFSETEFFLEDLSQIYSDSC